MFDRNFCGARSSSQSTMLIWHWCRINYWIILARIPRTRACGCVYLEYIEIEDCAHNLCPWSASQFSLDGKLFCARANTKSSNFKGFTKPMVSAVCSVGPLLVFDYTEQQLIPCWKVTLQNLQTLLHSALSLVRLTTSDFRYLSITPFVEGKNSCACCWTPPKATSYSNQKVGTSNVPWHPRFISVTRLSVKNVNEARGISFRYTNERPAL